MATLKEMQKFFGSQTYGDQDPNAMPDMFNEIDPTSESYLGVPVDEFGEKTNPTGRAMDRAIKRFFGIENVTPSLGDDMFVTDKAEVTDEPTTRTTMSRADKEFEEDVLRPQTLTLTDQEGGNVEESGTGMDEIGNVVEKTVTRSSFLPQDELVSSDKENDALVKAILMSRRNKPIRRTVFQPNNPLLALDEQQDELAYRAALEEDGGDRQISAMDILNPNFPNPFRNATSDPITNNDYQNEMLANFLRSRQRRNF
jgi:hypothetical protein